MLSLNFVPLIFSLTYATKDTTKDQKRDKFFQKIDIKIGIVLVLFWY